MLEFNLSALINNSNVTLIYQNCSVHFLFTDLHFGPDVCRAALRPPPPFWHLLGQSRRTQWLSQHGAGRQLGSRLCVRVFGKAEWRGLGRTGFSFHHQDGRREDGDWREREGESVSLDCCPAFVVTFTSSDAK